MPADRGSLVHDDPWSAGWSIGYRSGKEDAVQFPPLVISVGNTRARAVWDALRFGVRPSWMYENERHYTCSYWAHLWVNSAYAARWLTWRETSSDRDFAARDTTRDAIARAARALCASRGEPWNDEAEAFYTHQATVAIRAAGEL